MSRLPFTPGVRIEDGLTRRSVDSLVHALNTSGVTRRRTAVNLSDGSYSEPILYYDAMNKANPDAISTTTYTSLSVLTFTAEPAPGVTYVAHVTADVTLLDAAAASLALLSIYDGSTRTEVAQTIANGGGYYGVSLSYVVRFTDRRTFVIQARKNAAGDGSYTTAWKHLSVCCTPMCPRYYQRSDWFEVTAQSAVAQREALRGIYLLRASDLRQHPSNYYRIRAGVRGPDGPRWLVEYDGRVRSLPAGTAVPLHGGGEMDEAVRENELFVVGVERVGTPDRLDYTSVLFDSEIVGG